MLLPTRLLCVAQTPCLYGSVPAVHIPLDELEARQHELAPRFVEMQVLCTGVSAFHALGWLHARGRRARLKEISEAESEGWITLTHPVPPSPTRKGTEHDPPLPLGEGQGVRASNDTHQAQSPRYRLWEPNEFLQEIAPSLAPGRALDLACGSGREAVYLADLGWQVVAVDQLPDALARGRDLQARYAPDAPPIRWIEADLENDWQPDEPFQLVLCFFYLYRPLIPRIADWLLLGGHLLMETFTTIHRAHFGRPAPDERVLRPGELPTLLPSSMAIRHYDEGWHTRGHTARLWAQKVG